MNSFRRHCINSPNIFCYIYEEYSKENERKKITTFVKQAYVYFGVMFGDQNQS